jgi:TPR repeat protein
MLRKVIARDAGHATEWTLRWGTMKQRIKTFFAGGPLALALFGTAMAGPLEDGKAAALRGDYKAAVSLWLPLADQGNVDAQVYLGIMYMTGEGVPRDDAQALVWLRKAADQGNAIAQYDLGTMYDDGQGIPQDYFKAAAWYRKAADQGYASAQVSLGAMYDHGQGVLQDYVLAYMWENLAAAQPEANDLVRELAINNRDKAATHMTPAQIAEAQEIAREWKPK